MASLVPAGIMAAFALMRPSTEFKVAITGRGCPAGHTVRYPRPPCGTTATFSEYAAAVEGMLQALSGMAKSREVWPCRAGPPNGPGARRVSATRQGVTGTNCSGTCANPSGETVNAANNKANRTTTDKKTWRMECMEFLLKLANELSYNGGIDFRSWRLPAARGQHHRVRRRRCGAGSKEAEQVVNVFVAMRPRFGLWQMRSCVGRVSLGAS